VELDVDLTADDLELLVGLYKDVYREGTGEHVPEDPREQLRLSIEAVFKSLGY
jgi:pyruvate,orthophosphate dikinase